MGKWVQARFAQFLQGRTDVALPHVPSHRASFSRGLRKLVLPPHFCMSRLGGNRGLDKAQLHLQILSSFLSQLPSSSCFPNCKSTPQIQVWVIPANEGHELCLYPVPPPLSPSPINWTSFHSHSVSHNHNPPMSEAHTSDPTFTKVESKCQRMITWRLPMINDSSWASFPVGLNGHKQEWLYLVS